MVIYSFNGTLAAVQGSASPAWKALRSQEEARLFCRLCVIQCAVSHPKPTADLGMQDALGLTLRSA